MKLAAATTLAAVLLGAAPLVAEEAGSGAARSADLPDALAAGWKGQKTCENLHEDDRIRVLRCTFPPNVGHERHFHPAYFVYVLSGGRGRVTDPKGTREFEDQTGDFWANDPVEWHESLNIGDSTLTYLLVERKQ